MLEEKEDVQELVHLEAVDDIIGKPPSWIIRRGTIIIIGIIILVFAGASLIKYPNVIKGKAMIEVLPTGKKLITCRLRPELADKVKIGQKATVKLRDIKNDRIGFLMATVTEITNDMNSIIVNLSLNKEVTTTGYLLKPAQLPLIAEVQIIGKKETLLHRLFFRE